MNGVTVLHAVDMPALIRAGKVCAFRKNASAPMLFCHAECFEAVLRKWPEAVELTAEECEAELQAIVDGAG